MATESTATETESQPADGVTPEATVTQPAEDTFKSEESKAAVLADLMKERAARKELEERLQKIDDEKLSELERAQKAASEAETALAEITRQNLINSRALAKGLPADLAGFITGTDEATVDAQIDTLMSKIAAPRTPAPDPSQGPRPQVADPDAEFNTYAALLNLPSPRK